MRSLPHGCPTRSSIARLARKLGGKVLRIDQSTFNSLPIYSINTTKWDDVWEQAPFTSLPLALHWDRKVVAYVGDVPWPNIVHEMGHVFASNIRPFDGGGEDEIAFLGWEVALAKRYNLDAWIEGNRDYVVHDGYSMGDMPRKELLVFLHERLRVAKETKLVTHNGRPISIRT